MGVWVVIGMKMFISTPRQSLKGQDWVETKTIVFQILPRPSQDQIFEEARLSQDQDHGNLSVSYWFSITPVIGSRKYISYRLGNVYWRSLLHFSYGLCTDSLEIQTNIEKSRSHHNRQTFPIDGAAPMMPIKKPLRSIRCDYGCRLLAHLWLVVFCEINVAFKNICWNKDIEKFANCCWHHVLFRVLLTQKYLMKLKY